MSWFLTHHRKALILRGSILRSQSTFCSLLLSIFKSYYLKNLRWNRFSFLPVETWNYNTNRNNVRKSLVICATQLRGGLLFKKLKYFEAMINIFEFSRVWENAESWLVYANKLFWIAQPHFSNDIIKQS